MDDRRQFFDRQADNWQTEVSTETIDRILEFIDIRPGHRVLDVGTGTGILIPHLRSRVGDQGRIYAADFSAAMLARAQQDHHCLQVEFLLASVSDLPLGSGTVDRIVCFSAFPHFPDHPAAVTELARVLRSGGRLAICHAESRDTINRLHQEVGGAVKHDMIPHPDRLSGLLESRGLVVTNVVDSDIYVVTGDKPH